MFLFYLMVHIEYISETPCLFNKNKISDSVQYVCQFDNTPSSQNFKINCSGGYRIM
jgi:hypothetical protein